MPRGVLYAGGLVAAAGVLYLGLAWGGASAVPAGTHVLGVDIGGLEPAAAQARLETELAPRAAAAITVAAAEKSFPVNPAGAGLRFDAAATVEAARSGSWSPGAVLGRFVGGREVPPVVTADTTKLTTAMRSVARAVDVAPADADVSVAGEGAELSSPSDGVKLDVEGASEAVVTSYLRTDGPVALPVAVTAPAVGREAAEKALTEIALPALSEPITVTATTATGATATATVTPALLGRALSFDPKDGALVPVLDGATLLAGVERAFVSVEKPGRDASFVIRNDRPVVVPSVTGYGVSPESLSTAVAGVMTESGDERVATVTLGTIQPKLTTEQAKALRITQVIGSYTQRFPYAEYRVKNVGRAAKYMQGKVLKPGETYSMNDTIRERTEQNGYVTGIRIDQGRFVEDLGGGVSIITTATWSAAFYAGLERVEQRAHSLYISRYKPGLEATVAWGSLDLKFKNSTPNGVLITTRITDESITVTLWGTKQYDDVRAVFGERKNLTPFGRVFDTGPDCRPTNGVDGFTIDVTREFVKGGKVVKSEVFTTVYEPTLDVTCGPDPSKVTPSPTPSGSASGSGSPAPKPSAPSAQPTPKPSASRS